MRRTVIGAQNVSRMCLVCGTHNAAGLHARFYELDGGELLGLFQPKEEHQGYPGRLHGGLAAAVLDETIGRSANIEDPGGWGVTVEMNVRYRKPVPNDREIRVVARTTRHSPRIFEGTGEIVLEDGTIAVEASGRYMRLPIDRIAEGELDGQWFEDDRARPASVDLMEP